MNIICADIFCQEINARKRKFAIIGETGVNHVILFVALLGAIIKTAFNC